MKIFWRIFFVKSLVVNFVGDTNFWNNLIVIVSCTAVWMFGSYQVYKYELRISDNRWCTCEVCAMKIWLCTIIVSSTSVRRLRVINWKRVWIVLCCCVQCVERAFADSINFLFSFEENCCWIIPITSSSLWWTCSTTRHVWTIVSVFEKWWFRGCKQGTRKTDDVELQALLDEDDSQTLKQLVELLGVGQQTVFNRPREMGKIQKFGRWISELNDGKMEKRKNMWHFASSIQQEVVFASYS